MPGATTSGGAGAGSVMAGVVAGLSNLADSAVGMRVHPIRASTVIKANPAMINPGFIVTLLRSCPSLRGASLVCFEMKEHSWCDRAPAGASTEGHLNSAEPGPVCHSAQEL